MKRLTEWIEVDTSTHEPPKVASPHTDLALDNLIGQCGNIPYAELTIVLVNLRFLAMVHQTNHWIAKGDSFWGDHLLFEELYVATLKEIDCVAERSVGLGSDANVNLSVQLSMLVRMQGGYASNQTIPMGNELAKRSLVAEFNFMKVLTTAISLMRSNGTLTEGLEGALQNIADGHEAAIYKLKRRCESPAMGL